jgi:hypothetical protein
MRQFSLFAICLVLFFCGTVSAQQALVEYQEKDDPCALFKMRLLVPGDHVDFTLRAQKLKDGVDSKMVWNPCPQPDQQFAFALVEPTPAPRSSGFQFPMVKSGEKKQAEFHFFSAFHPSASSRKQ